MKQYLLTIFISLLAVGVHAQLDGDGFYRVKNEKTQRYINVIDNKGSIDKSSTQADLGSIITVKGFDNVATDPGSVIYFRKVDSEYDLVAQGTSVHNIVGITVQVIKYTEGNRTYYRAYKSYSGISRYLFDLNSTALEVGFVTTTGSLNSGTANWKILPISTGDDNYFAVKPEIQVSDAYYTTFYTAFANRKNNTGDKAYYISQVDGGVAVWKEVEGDIPAATPVIMRLTSGNVTDHKMTPLLSTPSTVTGNVLLGTYFNSGYDGHINRVAYNANTMRVLGRLSDGSIGFIKATNLDYIPHNTAYLKVDKSAPNEIKLMTEAEYAAWKEQERLKTPVTLTAVNITREYGEENPELTYTVEGTLLGGQPVLSCAATKTSPVGTYPITIAKGDVVNLTPTLVNGTLTITKAPLKIQVGNYTREYGEENPSYAFKYEGWKNGESQANLTTLPVVKTDATPRSNVGDYVLKPEGATSPNYAITYENGKLTVTPAPLSIKANDATRIYGEQNPAFTLTYTGWKNDDTPNSLTNQAVVQTEATVTSHTGTYVLTPSGAESANYNISYYNGRLTVTPATVTITAGNATREYGTTNPAFTVTYSGWKNQDNPECLTQQPVVTTQATAASHAGTYDIKPSGAESQDYTFSYVNGTLTITPAMLTIIPVSVSREYGEENPAFTLIYNGWKNNDTPESLIQQPLISTQVTKESHVGNYEITASGALSQDYNINYYPGSITIKPAPLTISVGNYQRAVGEENPEITPVYEGFKNDDTAESLDKQPVITIEATADSPAGTYPITVSGAESNDYTISYVNGTLDVFIPAAIGDITLSRHNETYSLNGTRVRQNTPLRKGIYVIGGRKVVVK